MLMEERGAEIDEHEVVLRLNQAPTNDFEKYVGSKTTHRQGEVWGVGGCWGVGGGCGVGGGASVHCLDITRAQVKYSTRLFSISHHHLYTKPQLWYLKNNVNFQTSFQFD